MSAAKRDKLLSRFMLVVIVGWLLAVVASCSDSTAPVQSEEQVIPRCEKYTWWEGSLGGGGQTRSACYVLGTDEKIDCDACVVVPVAR